MTPEQRSKVVAEARALVGVPFQHAGRNEYGLDCLGLIVLAARNAGLDVYDNCSYSQIVNPEFMAAEIEAAAERLPGLSSVLPGDVVLFSVAGSPQHMALISEKFDTYMLMVHSYQSAGRVVEHPLDRTWRRRVVACYTWRSS
jgi:cell wall-associated NlpC family hydrolase